MLTDVPGVAVGHWSDPAARTGCTVVLLDDGAVASGEVRGGAPGTREFELLGPQRLVAHIDAVVLTGGSAFGLAACDGVVRWCAEHGRGYQTRAGPVPIVIGAVLFDLGVGDAAVRPGSEEGYEAASAATNGRFDIGAVGAGTGATVGSWRGPDHQRAGGIGTATCRHGPVVVSALCAVNAYGDVVPAGREPEEIVELNRFVEARPQPPFQATTLAVIATNAPLDKAACLLMAQSGHDGLARALEPVHTTVDGDAVVGISTAGTAAAEAAAATVAGATEVAGATATGGPVTADIRMDAVRLMAARATTAAVRAAVASSR